MVHPDQTPLSYCPGRFQPDYGNPLLYNSALLGTLYHMQEKMKTFLTGSGRGREVSCSPDNHPENTVTVRYLARCFDLLDAMPQS